MTAKPVYAATTAPIRPYAPRTSVSASAVSSHLKPTYRMIPAANSNVPNTARRRNFQDTLEPGTVCLSSTGMIGVIHNLQFLINPHNLRLNANDTLYQPINLDM